MDAGEAALEQVKAQRPDLVLLDNRLPGISGLETLQQLRAHDPSLLVILMTAFATLDDAVTAMRLGAADFVRKPIGLAELELAVERVVQNDRLRQELRYYRGQRDGRSHGGLIGDSEAMQQLRHTVERLRGVQRAKGGGPTILIVGETGTGKGLFARTLHQSGARKGGPFIEVNCTAIPEALLESELFGHEKGAFTDAHAAKPGLIEAAEGGTLFLDEIGHVSGAVQAKLLKVIEERTVRRLGSVRDRATDVWVLAATNRDLEKAVKSGAFREDLYHRLRVLEIAVPPLRARGDDVLELAEHFVRVHASQYGVAAPRLSPAARAALKAYRWPGNVRELANIMERAVLLNDERRDRAEGSRDAPARGAGERAPGDVSTRRHRLGRPREEPDRAGAGAGRRQPGAGREAARPLARRASLSHGEVRARDGGAAGRRGRGMSRRLLLVLCASRRSWSVPVTREPRRLDRARARDRRPSRRRPTTASSRSS